MSELHHQEEQLRHPEKGSWWLRRPVEDVARQTSRDAEGRL
jgi:hypothetical protein